MEDIRSALVRIEALLARPVAPVAPVEFLDTEGAAHYLGMSTVTLEQWRCEGTGPAFCKVGQFRPLSCR